MTSISGLIQRRPLSCGSLEMAPLDGKIRDLKRQGKLSSPPNLPHNKEVDTGYAQLILPFKKEEKRTPRGSETTPVPSLGLALLSGSGCPWRLAPHSGSPSVPKRNCQCWQPNRHLSLLPAHENISFHFKLSLSFSSKLMQLFYKCVRF